MTFDTNERSVLARLADEFIPAEDGFPAASAAGVAAEGLDMLLKSRPDIAAKRQRWQQYSAQADLAGYDDEVEIVPEGICPVFSVITKSKYRIDAKVLLTRRQLALESKIMQHCVGQDHMKYHKKWAAGAAIYLHLETVELDKDGAEIGAGHGFTLEMYRQRVEMERQWAPTQIRGKFNASAPSWLRNTVKTGAFYDVLMSKKQKFAPLKQTLKGEHNGSN